MSQHISYTTRERKKNKYYNVFKWKICKHWKKGKWSEVITNRSIILRHSFLPNENIRHFQRNRTSLQRFLVFLTSTPKKHIFFFLDKIEEWRGWSYLDKIDEWRGWARLYLDKVEEWRGRSRLYLDKIKEWRGWPRLYLAKLKSGEAGPGFTLTKLKSGEAGPGFLDMITPLHTDRVME